MKSLLDCRLVVEASWHLVPVPAVDAALLLHCGPKQLPLFAIVESHGP